MSRFLLIALPLLIAVGATVNALRKPVSGTADQRFRMLLAGAFGAGIVLSLISYTLVRSVEDNTRTDAYNAEHSKALAEAGTQYQQQITMLNAQVLELQRRLANQPQKTEVTQASAMPAPAAANAPLYWAQDTLREGDSGELELRFKTYSQLNVAAFVAICSEPCRVERAGAGPGSEGTELAGSTSKNVAGYIFKKPKPMPAGTEGFVVLRGPSKSGFKVTEFRALQESEIPASLQ